MSEKNNEANDWAEYENSLICLNSITGMTIHMLSYDGQVQATVSENPSALSLYLTSHRRLKKIIEHASSDYPSFFSEVHGASYFSVKTPAGILLCGPALHMSVKETSYAEQFEDGGLSVTEKLRYIESFAYTPVIDYKKFIELALVIANLINKKDVSIEELVMKKQLFYFKEKAAPFGLGGEKYARTSLPLEFRDSIIEAIESGDAPRLTNAIKEVRNWNFNLVAATPLKSYRLTFAMFSGVIMSECVNAGLDENLAVRLCEYYIDWIERGKTIEEIFGIFLKMLYDYTDRFYKKRKSRLSKLSAEFEKYVYLRMGERISLSKAAEELNISQQYLCKKIKKDFGMSPNKLIHKIKTEEAKRLLKAKEMPLSEIWLHLGYCDQSHFNKVFKECAGMTPGEYLLKAV